MIRWNERRYRELGDLIDQGLKGPAIAKKMGVTTNVVIGAAWRAGWSVGTPRTAVQREFTPWDTALRPSAGAHPSGEDAMLALPVRVDHDTYNEVRELAERSKTSMAAVLRELIEFGLITAQEMAEDHRPIQAGQRLAA
jgi:hypothetical protein